MAWGRRRATQEKPPAPVQQQYICGAQCQTLFCPKHECLSCDDARAPASRYCTGHKCSRGECEHPRQGTATVCQGHKCAADNCDGDSGARLRVKGFCPAHRCSQKGCKQERCAPASLCAEHRCHYCSAPRDGASRFCTAHRCSHIGCLNERNGRSLVCAEHDDHLHPGRGLCQSEVVWRDVGFSYVRRSTLAVHAPSEPSPTSAQHASGLPHTPPASAVGGHSLGRHSVESQATTEDGETNSAEAIERAVAAEEGSSLQNSTLTPAVTSTVTGSQDSGLAHRAAAAFRPPPVMRRPSGDDAIRVSHYELGRVLGRGAFSEVRLALDALDPLGPWWAVKVLSVDHMRQMGAEDLLCNEIALLRKFQHDHIIRLVECIRSGNLIFMVLELLEGGELFDRIRETEVLPEEDAQEYFAQLLSGVMYMHQCGVAHRDLKPENALFDSQGVLHIADFGFASLQGPGELLDDDLGTPEYQAPEVYTGARYDGMAADMWSLGVVLFVMMAGWLPFDGDTDDELAIAKSKPVNYPEDFPPGARQLCERLLQTEPSKRPRAQEVCTDPWVTAGLERAGCTGGCTTPPQEQLLDVPLVHLSDLPSVPVQGTEHLLPGKQKDPSQWPTLSGLLGDAKGFFTGLGAATPTTPAVAMPINRLRPRRGVVRRHR